MASAARILPDRFLRSNRAVELNLVELVGLIIAIMFIVLLVSVIAGLMNIFTGPPDQGTTTMYNKIFDSVEMMMDPANGNDSCKITSGYIEPNFAIVGFNMEGIKNAADESGDKGDEDYGYIEEHCGVEDNVYKPKTCMNLACLCLCNGGTGDISGNDCSGSSICKRVSKKTVRFLSSYKNEPTDLVLYGESCWSGSDSGVIGGYLITRSPTRSVVSSETDISDTTITVLEIPRNTGELASTVSSILSSVPECESLMRDLKSAKTVKKVAEQAKGDTLTSELNKAGAISKK